jgi:hypothetical protein
VIYMCSNRNGSFRSAIKKLFQSLLPKRESQVLRQEAQTISGIMKHHKNVGKPLYFHESNNAH